MRYALTVQASGPVSNALGSHPTTQKSVAVLMTDHLRDFGRAGLFWLALANFSMGIDGYVLAGLLPQIASDLEVSSAAAGQLVAVFALTGAFAGPALSAFTGRWERKATISLALLVFILGNLMVAVAPDYSWAIAGRVVSAVGGALLNAVVSAYVIARTPVEQRGRALSFVLGGWLAATALGVPLGLVIGQADWRAPLFLVAGVGAIALIGILIKVPRLTLPARPLRESVRPLGQPRVLAALVIPIGIMCASYLCFTYAAFILEPRIGAGLPMILIMFGYGLISLLGNAVSGRSIDRISPVRVLAVIIASLIAVAAIGTVGLALSGIAGAVIAIFWFFGCAFFNGGMGVPLQARLAAMSSDSLTILLALNASAITLGSAFGGMLGGAMLATGFPPEALVPSAGAILVVTGAVLFQTTRARTQRTQNAPEVAGRELRPDEV